MSGDPTVGVQTESLDLPPELLAQIYRQARAEFPNECCGYLIGRGAAAELRRCVNAQDRLHTLDPETYPRTAANGYTIYGRELRDLVASFDGDRPATVIYHSHPRVGAYFSAEDALAARSSGYPVDYLVIDAQEDRIGGAKLFRERDGAFTCIATYPGADL